MLTSERFLPVALVAVGALGLHSCGGEAPSGPPPDGDVIAVRQGDVVGLIQLASQVPGRNVSLLTDPNTVRFVVPTSAGFFAANGQFVGYEPGRAQIVARMGGVSDTFDIEIRDRELATGSLETVGRGVRDRRFTSDIWVHGSHAYTGTWGLRTVAGSALGGDQLYVWDVSDPTRPALTDSIQVDARTVNDVKIRADGTIGVLSHEGSVDGMNGITIFDLVDPARPAVVTRFTTGLETGVHNVWIQGDYVYAVADGQLGMRVIDIAQPQNPELVATFYAGSSFLHDIYVRDGLAFLSHWDAGLVILDVGNGISGGTPASPVEVSRVTTECGQTHNAWYWPDAGYVFVGEEDFNTPGRMHVVNVRDLRNPREEATFEVSGETPHNFWLDEARGILYLAWYSNGIQALDVSGDLLGELDRQGRVVASVLYGGGGGCLGASATATCTWAPQLHNGMVYISDMNTGLWILQPSF